VSRPESVVEAARLLLLSSSRATYVSRALQEHLRHGNGRKIISAWCCAWRSGAQNPHYCTIVRIVVPEM